VMKPAPIPLVMDQVKGMASMVTNAGTASS
jgi:hypothetical protein